MKWRHAALLLVLALPACERGAVTACVAKDEKLLHTDYKQLAARVRAGEPGAGDEASDLLLRLAECLP